MREYYPLIREIYKRLSGLSGSGSVFAIGWNTFTEFINTSLNILHKDYLRLDDCDRTFISVNATSRKSTLIPANALTRFKFLEVLLRLGIKRYFDGSNNEAPNEVEAIKILGERNLATIIENADQ